jgi:hypothetical protein
MAAGRDAACGDGIGGPMRLLCPRRQQHLRGQHGDAAGGPPFGCPKNEQCGMSGGCVSSTIAIKYCYKDGCTGACSVPNFAASVCTTGWPLPQGMSVVRRCEQGWSGKEVVEQLYGTATCAGDHSLGVHIVGKCYVDGLNFGKPSNQRRNPDHTAVFSRSQAAYYSSPCEACAPMFF